MSYKWKPSKSARREFAQRMQDPQEQAAYYARREARADKRRAGSQFDYSCAGGNYIPTLFQYEEAASFLLKGGLTPEQNEACRFVTSGYSCQDKVHHDFIHIVN